MMQKTKSWRDVLEVIVSDAEEKQRIARTLQISSFTLQRWIRGEENPRMQQLYQLLQALPQHQRVLLPLIAEEFEVGNDSMLEQLEEIEEIPSIFYAQVLRGSTAIPAIIRFWSLTSMILQQALMQLDPLRKGLLLRVACFLPPNADGRLYCLREVVTQGTPPWDGNLAHTAILLGAESLAGYALSVGRPMMIDAQNKGDLFPIAGREDEVSRLAFPIARGKRMAGVLLISSTQEGYFTPVRLSLIHRYADLLAMAFEGEDFYEPELLDLVVMPPPSEQADRLATFRQRLAILLKQVEQQQQAIDAGQAELQIWQQFAEEFLQHSL
jgi:hypothetical protein